MKITFLLPSLIFLILSSTFTSSVKAQSRPNEGCQKAITSVSEELATKGAFVPFNSPVLGRVQPKVFLGNGNFSQEYYGYPTERPQKVRFRLTGDPEKIWYGVMSSPQFLTTLTSQITTACSQVGMVEYQHFYEGQILFGYFSDGTIQAFTWVNSDDSRLGKWGYYYSP
ncbi:hypothetical protein [Picosynechococcus sp. PCC 8807]|uniref:hypothetical protein n=1 Tax=Picosynechococcus sp. PCC 8807 TaxID=195248 RepID=UPI0012EE2289|nr:hypothetical protein [Picosynechococcus sp. PCC 8807]